MTLTIQDRIEIQDLMGRFALAVDVNGPEAMRDIFSIDSQFIIDQFQIDVKGLDNIIHWMTESADSFPPGLNHVLSNFVIEGNEAGDEANLKCISQAIQSYEGKISTYAIGRYDDKLVKTVEGWRLKEHQLILSQ